MNEILFKDDTHKSLEVRRTLLNGMKYIEYLYEGQVFSWLYEDDPLRDSFTLSSVIMALYNNANRILILGAGCGSYAILLNQLRPESEITLVDINPHVPHLAKHFGIDSLKKAEYFVDDAVEFIKNTKNNYDMILVDVFDSNGIPIGFTKTSFFKEVFNHLEPNGIFVMNTNMKTVLPIENALLGLTNPLHYLVDRIKKSGFSVVYESRLTNSSLLISSKNQLKFKSIREFFLCLLKNHSIVHIKSVAYGMLMRIEPIMEKEYSGEEQQLSHEYKNYVRKVIYSLYRYSPKLSIDSLETILQEIYLKFISQDIKKGVDRNYSDLFDIINPEYYEAICAHTDNKKLSFNEFYSACRYISTGRNGISISSVYKNPFMFFIEGIFHVRNDISEKALLCFESMNSFFSDIE